MKVKEAKQIVKQIYPDAVCRPRKWGVEKRIILSPYSSGFLNKWLGGARTRNLAWINAAERITKEKTTKKEEDEKDNI